MAGYTPLFDSIFSGSLCGQYPDTAAWVFLLALSDKHGVVDMSPAYISRITGMPEHDLLQCIERFMKPDPDSRTSDHEGRRLELVDPGRPWGWRILNFAAYRERARLAAKNAREVETARNKERMRKRTAADRPSPPPTAADPLSNANENASISRAASRPTDTEFNAVKALYPKRQGSQRWPDARKAIRARLREGHSLDEMQEGTSAYLAWCEHEGKIGTQFVMQAATFYGNNKQFTESWELSDSDGHGESFVDAAKRLGIERRHQEGDDEYRRRVADAVTAERYRR